MKREFLETELEKLNVEDKDSIKTAVDSIMAEYGKAVNKTTEELKKTTAERDTLKDQLTDANKTIEEFKNVDVEGKDKAISEWKEKYEKATKEAEEKISKMTYDNVVNGLVNAVSFSSESAKKGFIQELEKKELKLEGDKLLGWNDFVDEYKKSDPNAFTQEKAEETKVTASTGDTHERNFPASSFVDLRSALKEQYNK